MLRLTAVVNAGATMETCLLTGEVTAIHARIRAPERLLQLRCVPVAGQCG